MLPGWLRSRKRLSLLPTHQREGSAATVCRPTHLYRRLGCLATVQGWYRSGVSNFQGRRRRRAFHGFSEEALRKHYWPACRAINLDNALGKFIFGFSHLIQKTRFSRRGVLRMTAREQASQRSERQMSSVLWDLFTGSAPYRDVLMRTMKPAFIGGLISNLVVGNLAGLRNNGSTEGMADEV